MRKMVRLMIVVLLSLALSGCQLRGDSGVIVDADSPAATTAAEIPEEENMFTVTSSGIVDGVIGDAYGARGTQKRKIAPSRSFELSFSNLPAGTACLALTMIDPDGMNWVHWLAANIPTGGLAENASVDLADSFIQGKNGFGFAGYGGPMPPRGTHRYVVTVYALSAPLDLENGFTLKQLKQSLEGMTLGTAVLTGDYTH